MTHVLYIACNYISAGTDIERSSSAHIPLNSIEVYIFVFAFVSRKIIHIFNEI